MISTGKKTHSISCVVEIKNFLDKILQSMIYKSTFLCAFFKKNSCSVSFQYYTNLSKHNP